MRVRVAHCHLLVPCPFTTKCRRTPNSRRSSVLLATDSSLLVDEDPEHCHQEAKHTAPESIRIGIEQSAKCEGWKGTCIEGEPWRGGRCVMRSRRSLISAYSTVTLVDESEVEASATEDVPTRAIKRRKISDDVAEDTTPSHSISPAPRRSSRRSEPASKAVVDDDAISTPKPNRPPAGARRRSVAACNNVVDKGEEKALNEEKQSLKRDRQTFEQESQRERAELNKRESKVEKLDSQLKSKLAAAKEKERDAKQRETECKKWEQALKKRETECAQQEADLEEREKALQKKEQESGDKALSVNISQSEEAINELDAKWQCAL